jgi:outer membrane protein OmpA-like peptidoglycan-associated protein
VTTYGSQVTPQGAPYAVTGLSATPSDGALTISYTQPASLNGGTWVQYQYFVTPAGTPFSSSPTGTDATEAHTSFTFTGLTNGVAYDIKVVALTTSNGSPSTANTTLLNMVAAAQPNTPAISITQISATSITINWSSQGDGGSAITAYTISVTNNGNIQPCYVNLSTTHCTLAGLAPLDAISASATATNLIGTSASVSATYSVIGVVATPTGITVDAGDTQLTINFTQVSSGDAISGYQYTYDGISFIDAATTTSPIVITGLTNDTSYTLYIRAVGTIYGAGSLSETITAIPTAYVAPTPPPSGSGSSSGGFSSIQNSSITSFTPMIGFSETTTLLAVMGSFPDPIIYIKIDTVTLDKSLWRQSATQVTITMLAHSAETVTIQINNGLAPALPNIVFTYTDRPTNQSQSAVSTQNVDTSTTVIVSKINKITIRLKVPFRPNSYFLNDASKRELLSIVKRYNNYSIFKYLVLGYVSASPNNPYPRFLGTWRARAVLKQLVADGFTPPGAAIYGGIFKGKSLEARKDTLVLYLKN